MIQGLLEALRKPQETREKLEELTTITASSEYIKELGEEAQQKQAEEYKKLIEENNNNNH